MTTAVFGVGALVAVGLFGLAGYASAQEQEFSTKFTTPYCTDSYFPAACTKKFVIYNNSNSPIYPVIQGALQQGVAKGDKCAVGDVWLQAAFGDITRCFPSTLNYLVYVNGVAGIPARKYATVNVPWWSKRQADQSNPDTYIDWWRGARIYIFDDRNAVNASFQIDKARPVIFPKNSPQITCDKTNSASVCQSTIAYQSCVSGTVNNRPTDCVPGTLSIAAETPQQLNEYTLGSVDFVYGLVNFNVNYNVSNVDQVYLPVAIEPLIFADKSKNNATNTPGYLGTTLGVVDLRNRLMTFTGATGTINNPQNPTKWPIYTVEMKNGTPLYPNAGIRVPGAANVFNFLAQPSQATLDSGPQELRRPQLQSDGEQREILVGYNSCRWHDRTVADLHPLANGSKLSAVGHLQPCKHHVPE